MSDSEDLRRLYRQLPPEEPSPELDASVRAAVLATLPLAGHAAPDAQPPRWQRWQKWQSWQAPLATAATVVLAVSLLLQQAPPPSTTTTAAHPDDASGVASEYAEPRSVASAGIFAQEFAKDVRPPGERPQVRRLDELSVSPPPPPPPPPAPVEAPAFVPPPAAIMALPAPVAATAAPAMDRSSTPLQQLSLEAIGLPATEFCVRLSAQWPSETAAPDCPAADGTHEWPAPVAVRWTVVDGTVRSVEPLSP